MVESLRLLPVNRSKKRRLSKTVAAGRFCTSSSRSFSVVWSTFGGLPPPLFGSREAPRSSATRVSLDRGEADVEEAGDRGLGRSSFLEGSYDPPA